MTRGERSGLVLVGIVIGAFAAVLATGIADRLGGQTWFSNGANVIQWVSGPGTFVAVAVAVGAWLNRTCSASPFCFRQGEFPVDATLEKVCRHHHTLEGHRSVHRQHADRHASSGRLDRGHSHGGAL